MLPGVLVTVTTWSLEITSAADLRPVDPPGSVEVRRAARVWPELGRFLYTAAGGNWYWVDRLGWSYERWAERMSDPCVETWILYQDGTPAGYFELDGRNAGDIEIAYLGLMPTFLGRRLGGPLLTAAIRRGWAMGAGRVWVHTCTLDSPHALANYQARGMRIFKEQTEELDLPGEPPGAWPGAGIHGPHISPTPAPTI